MIQHVVERARQVDLLAQVVVATDDERISDHCKEIGVDYVMTSVDCPSGTDRAREAVSQLKEKKPDFVINMQRDAPLTPPDFIVAMINSFKKDYLQLSSS